MQAPLGAVAGMRTLPRLVLSTSAAAALLAPHLLRQRNSASEGRGAARGHPSKGAAAAAAASLAPAAVASPAPAHGGPLASAARLTTTLRPLVLLLHSVSTLVLGRFLSLGIVSTLASWVSDRVVQFADTRKPVTAEAIDVGTVQQFCGQWVKVPARSDTMDAFCQLFGVPRWLRQATRLITGLEVCLTRDALVVRQICRVGWLSTVESFPLDGSASAPHKRRDMRSGKQLGAMLGARDGRMQLHVIFEGGLPGHATDTLELLSTPHGPELVVTHEASIEGRGEAQFREVYRHSGC